MSGRLDLPEGWGVARLHRGRAVAHERVARSYDHRGAVLTWMPGPCCVAAAAIACDLEHASRFAVPVRVPGGAETGVVLESWVATEVLAKLTGQPVLAFLRAHGVIGSLPVPRAEFDLAALGTGGVAQLVIVRSSDGERGAAFGIRLPAGRRR
jgi:hypothetical protein